jgi:MFS family permease
MTGFLLLGGPHAAVLGLETWSAVFLVFGAVVVACRVALARLPDRVPPMRLVAAALAVSCIGLLVVAWASGTAALLVGAGMLAAGVALLTPAVFAAIFGVVPPEERGAAAGTATVFIDLGFTGGPLAFGFVAAAAGIPPAFVVAAAVAGLGSLGTLIGRRMAERPAVAG